jgi:hypothetical protein
LTPMTSGRRRMIAMCDLQCTPAPRHWAGVSGVCRGAQTRVFRGKIISVCRRARRAHEPTQHNTFIILPIRNRGL